jgi:hypothetical protein
VTDEDMTDRPTTTSEKELVQQPADAVYQQGEVVLAVTQEGILVDGDAEAVESYIDKLRNGAGQLVDVAGVSKGAVGNLAGIAAGAAAVFAQSGQFVQLSTKSMDAIRNGNLMPGDSGFFRMMTTGDNGQFLQQLQWRPVALGPTQLLSVQMIAVQMALKMAIAEVNESIKRVEGKVDSLVKLAESNRIGDVKGHHAVVQRMVDNLDKTGVLPTTHWEAVASLGPELIVDVERLRAHITRTLDEFDASKPVQERAATLKRAVEDSRLGESLNLLIVAEESLNKWQRLELARVLDKDPQDRERVIAYNFDLLASQVAEDGQLYQRATEVLESYRRTTRIDGFRFWSVQDVAKHSKKLQDDLDAFANARRHQLSEWQQMDTPDFWDAADHVLDVAGDYGGRALNAAGSAVTSVFGLFSDRDKEKHEVTVRERDRSKDATED